ncbi:sulfatase-like hydrolase/transferase [Prosthecomicrobium pneumaticum]|uniref:Sulfatase N-terminal domain-containing protein n=1 Tax=Prosthecomicrobium pneumaticum TaxID=81895 RepID=A0A7W9FIU9_9HYPH|nr:hypothetical protein [Prosthecomicrobium pneumaticum]
MKHRHVGLNLLPDDLATLADGGARVLLRDYRGLSRGAFAWSAAAFAATAAIVFGIGREPVGWPLRLGLPLIALAFAILVWRRAGGAEAFVRFTTDGSRHFSAFVAACLDPRRWRRRHWLDMTDVAATAMPLPATRCEPDAQRPDIVVLHQESVFDPRLYGLPVTPDVAAFLEPEGGLYGPLNVDVFGGGSWQTEFSILTGFPASSFGADTWAIFRKGAGRFRHTLPLALKALGYETALASSFEKGFMNYDGFYAAAGVDERRFADDFPAPFDRQRLQADYHDATFFAAAEAALFDRPRTAPLFAVLLTNYNHGPHERRLVPHGAAEASRAFALRALDLPAYGEYYARLTETAAAYAAFRARLAERRAGRPLLILRYGDHQPALTREIAARTGRDHEALRFTTPFAIEAIGFTPRPVALPRPLDVAFLGTAALAYGRLPLDPIARARLALMDEIGADYVGTPSTARGRFHRAMIELGHVRLGAPGEALAATAPAPVRGEAERLSEGRCR